MTMIHPAFTCRLGSATMNNQTALMAAYPLICGCDQSCEPHEHSATPPGPDDWTICLHDGVTEHGHCPNVALDSLTDADG
jgi:hypothetical protein